MPSSDENHTPLNVKKFDTKTGQQGANFQTLLKKRQLAVSLSINKFDVILLISILFFVASLSFWMYVQFFL